MTATLQRNCLHKLRVSLLVFIEFQILSCIMIGRQRITILNPAPPQPQPVPRRRRKPFNPWVMPWILQRQEKGCYSNLLTDLIHTDIPGYQNFVRMTPTFFTSSKSGFTSASEVSHQFQEVLRNCTGTGNNSETPGNRRDIHLLAVSLHPAGLQTILAEFHYEHLCCLTTIEERKRVE